MRLRATLWGTVLAAIAAGAALSAGAQAAPAKAPAAFEPEARVVRVDRVRMSALVRVGARLVAAGERGRILVSDDDGATWSVAATPTTVTLTSLAFVDAKSGFATGHEATLLRTGDGGRTWKRVPVEVKEKAALFALRVVGTRAMAVGAYGAYLESADGGLTWKQRDIGPADFDRHLTGIASLGQGRFVLAGESGALLRSTDNGGRWELLKPPYEGSFFGIVELTGGAIIAYGMRGNAFRSEDGGNTWRRIDLGDYKGSLQAGVEFADGVVALAGGDGMIAVSADRGRTFIPKPVADRRLVGALERTASGRWLTAGPGGLRPAEQGRHP